MPYVSRSRFGEERRQTRRQPGHHDLSFGITETNVVLQHLQTVGGEHDPGIQHAAIDDAAPAQFVQCGLDRSGDHFIHYVRAGDRDGRVGAHASGVGADVAGADPLEVLCRCQGCDRPPVTDREQREFGPGEPLLDHKATSRVTEGGTREIFMHRMARLGDRLGDDNAFAPGQPVGLDDVETGHRVEIRERGRERGERRVARRRYARRVEHLFHPSLRPFEACSVGAGPKTKLALRPQPVGQATDERILWPDDEKIGVDLSRRLGGRRRNTGVAGTHHHRCIAPEHRRERVLAPSGPDHTNLHRRARQRVMRTARTDRVRAPHPHR